MNVTAAASSAGLAIELDTLGMLDATLGWPEQLRAALDTIRVDRKLVPLHDDVDNVVLLGVGASGLAADVVAALAGAVSAIPVVVSKDYELPGFVGSRTLVIALSLTGDTDETVDAATAALEVGARLVAVSNGGKLRALVEGARMAAISVGASVPVSRVALPAMVTPPLLVLEALGYFPGAAQWLALAAEQLGRRRDELVGSDLAGRLARRIGRTIPLVYGGDPIGAVAAERWKAAFNENPKIPAWCNRMPDVCYGEVAGWGQHGDVTRQVFTVIQLRHDHEHPLVSSRFGLIESLIAETVAAIESVHAEGEGAVAQLLDLCLVGDVVSLMLAGNEGVDPGPVPVVETLRKSVLP